MQIAELLFKLGHRRVATLEVPESLSRTQARRGSAIHSSLVELGAHVVSLRGADMVAAVIQQARLGQVTAVACPTNDIAMEVILALRAQGVSVPDVVTVTGFDATGPLGADVFGITNFRPPIDELGGRALQLATSLDDRDGEAPPRVLLPGEVTIGATAAPPSR